MVFTQVALALLADDARRGPVQRGTRGGEHAPRRGGAYDREMVRHLGDYVDSDTELYAAAVQIYEERLAAVRRGEACI